MIVGDVVSAQNYEYEISLTPEYSETTTNTDFGLIGLIISGAALFNPYEGGGGVALDGNFDLNGVFFIDACNGHPQNQGAYHYHGVPYCITDVIDVAGDHSTMIGVLLDGFPIYGPQDNGGDAPTDLDECHGHVGSTPEFPDGIYHYHLIESDEYSVPCYHGVVAASAGGLGDGAAAPADGQGTDGGPDFEAAAAELGVTAAALQAALREPPPDLAAAAAQLGVTEEALEQALGPPPN